MVVQHMIQPAAVRLNNPLLSRRSPRGSKTSRSGWTGICERRSIIKRQSSASYRSRSTLRRRARRPPPPQRAPSFEPHDVKILHGALVPNGGKCGSNEGWCPSPVFFSFPIFLPLSILCTCLTLLNFPLSLLIVTLRLSFTPASYGVRKMQIRVRDGVAKTLRSQLSPFRFLVNSPLPCTIASCAA